MGNNKIEYSGTILPDLMEEAITDKEFRLEEQVKEEIERMKRQRQRESDDKEVPRPKKRRTERMTEEPDKEIIQDETMRQFQEDGQKEQENDTHRNKGRIFRKAKRDTTRSTSIKTFFMTSQERASNRMEM